MIEFVQKARSCGYGMLGGWVGSGRNVVLGGGDRRSHTPLTLRDPRGR
ncbi:MAG: hypothetical protein K0R75_3968 [Paenibacillaceae bacterium]|nr:hypothetical protein [Paenibacillaceae bacterium]